MIRLFIIIIIVSFTVLNSFAQKGNDSVQSLNEVVVKSYQRIQRGDTLCVIPTANQRKFNVTGFELLRSMMLPGLRVNPITGELGLADGNSAVVLIDGRPVGRQDVMALRPQEIARVEYLQNPGPEFGYDTSMGAVINIVMKERIDGYAAAVVANNAVTTANGQNFAFAQYNRNNSQYGISLNSDYTSLRRRRLDNNNTYMLGDQPHTVSFKGINTPLKYTENTIQAGYNFFVPSNQILDITFKGVFYYSPDRAHAQEVIEDGKSPYFQLTEPYEKYLSPSLNIYYKYYLSKKAALTFNLVGNYRHTDYHHTVTEAPDMDFTNQDYNYNYGTKSDRQSYIGEIKYHSKFTRIFNLRVGARAHYAYTSNRYIGDGSTSDKLHDTNIYTYFSSYGYIGRVYYTLGLGLSGRITKQNGESTSKWIPSPELKVIYRLKGWEFNLNGSVIQNYPSLSEMASTEFQINRFEIKRGNPDLRNGWKYRMALRITKSLGPLNIQNTLSYSDARKPVMTCISREQTPDGYQFVTSFANQKGMSVLTNSLNLQGGLSNNLALTVGVNFNSYRSRGLTYTHSLNNWQFNVAAEWFAGNWNVGIDWRNRSRSLTGETISYVGPMSSAYVNYIIGNQWRFGLMGQYLFSKNGPTYREKTNSQYMTKQENLIVPAQGNMIMLTAAWNFTAGKQRKDANIDMTNEDNGAGIFK